MTVFSAFTNLIGVFIGKMETVTQNYLALMLSVMTFCGMLALFAGIFNRRAGKYIGIMCIIALIAITVIYVSEYRFNILPDGAVINVWS